MLRFIFSRNIARGDGFSWDTIESVDIEVPEIEARLSRGGYGDGYDITKLVGIELLPPTSGKE